MRAIAGAAAVYGGGNGGSGGDGGSGGGGGGAQRDFCSHSRACLLTSKKLAGGRGGHAPSTSASATVSFVNWPAAAVERCRHQTASRTGLSICCFLCSASVVRRGCPCFFTQGRDQRSTRLHYCTAASPRRAATRALVPCSSPLLRTAMRRCCSRCRLGNRCRACTFALHTRGCTDATVSPRWREREERCCRFSCRRCCFSNCHRRCCHPSSGASLAVRTLPDGYGAAAVPLVWLQASTPVELQPAYLLRGTKQSGGHLACSKTCVAGAHKPAATRSSHHP